MAEQTRRARLFSLRELLLVVLSCACLGACTGSGAQIPSPTNTSGSSGPGTPGPSGTPALPAVPDADRQLVIALVDAINATAGGPVQSQQDLLVQLAHPDFVGQQQQCTPATITIGLDPVLENLAETPGWTPTAAPGAGGTTAAAIPTGTLYRLPVLVLVYTDTRRTGTDLTSLRMAVVEGRAVLFPLCLN